MAKLTRTNIPNAQTRGKPMGIPRKKHNMVEFWQNMCEKTKDAAKKAISDTIMEMSSDPKVQSTGNVEKSFSVNLPTSLVKSSRDNTLHTTEGSLDMSSSFSAITTSSHDRPTVQPIGRHCIVIGRISSNKGLKSTKLTSGSKIQHDQAENMKKRREEGFTLGERLGQNAPTPIHWEVLESTFHKQQSCVDLEWCKDKKGQAAMVTDIEAFFYKLPKGSEVTVLLRCLDGLIVHRSSFN